MMLDETVTALGRHPEPARRARCSAQTVPIEQIVGSLARHGDFDREFRPRTETVRRRREHLAHLDPARLAAPVSLVRVGELYFVDDGHHRVSLARDRGQAEVDALVRRVCSIAWACACLTRADLDIKAAERDFLTQVPLPDPALRGLWLDDPEGYRRLADAARVWSSHTAHPCPAADCAIDRAIDPATAAAWWDLEVLPTVHRHAHSDGTALESSPAATYLLHAAEGRHR